jgi:hypothetical protein
MLIRIAHNQTVNVEGVIFRVARLRDEPYVCVQDPTAFVDAVKHASASIDIVSFMQSIGDRVPRYSYHLDYENLAVLPVTSYEHWWKRQIKDKTRNMVRKAQKGGINLRTCEFNDDFVRAIMGIYNESAVRQGKPFKHYGKDFDTVKAEHLTFIETSDFIGAFDGPELIGFAKLVHGKGASSLMQIISKIGFRDKAPTNALVAKAVEICSERGIPYLHYGIWSRRGLGDFKKHHGFVCFEVPRYFVPITLKGKLALRLRLYRRIVQVVPPRLLDGIISLRNSWNTYRYGSAHH